MHINNLSHYINIYKVEQFELGYVKIIVGELDGESNLTYSKSYLGFVVMELGRANILGFYNKVKNEYIFDILKQKIKDNIAVFNIADLIEAIKFYFKNSFTLSDITPDEAFHVLDIFMKKEESLLLKNYEDIYLRNFPICVQYKQAGVKIPYYLWTNIIVVVKNRLLKTLKEPFHPPIKEIEKISQDILFWDAQLTDVLEDAEDIKLRMSDKIFKMFELITLNIWELKNVDYALMFFAILETLKISNMTLWRSQNVFIKFMKQNKKLISDMKTSHPALYDKISILALKIKIDLPYVTEKL